MQRACRPRSSSGPAGEEIFTDKYGRVKVQFHWDREGKNDENSSCWVRVSPGLGRQRAGASYHIPRIGQEVIVDFLEGDPDRRSSPAASTTPSRCRPTRLPANAHPVRHQEPNSTRRAAADSNELRFEDKKGAEQIYLHAQKNEDIVVENDKTEKRRATTRRSASATTAPRRWATTRRSASATTARARSGANETVTVGANQTVDGRRQSHRHGGDSREPHRGCGAAADRGRRPQRTVGATQSHEIGVSDSWDVGIDRSVNIGTND